MIEGHRSGCPYQRQVHDMMHLSPGNSAMHAKDQVGDSKGISNNHTPQGRITAKLKGMQDQSVQSKLTHQLKASQNPLTQQAPAQSNNTGLPDTLKTSIEHLSGYAMDDVKVHYNSSKPAQFQAHAYAQGTDIHLASQQEKYLPHEAWHIVQQKQGRVKPTIQLKGKINLNDDTALEKEAEVMGEGAVKATSQKAGSIMMKAYQAPGLDSGVIQRVISQGGHYEIKDREKNRLYNKSGEATPPKPLGLYQVGEGNNAQYWEPRVKLMHKKAYDDFGVLSEEDKKESEWLQGFIEETKRMIRELPEGAIYIVGKNDCQQFSEILRALISAHGNNNNKGENKLKTYTSVLSSDSETEVDDGFRWEQIGVGTRIDHWFSGITKGEARILTGDVRAVGAHAITIVAVDGSTKIALQANAGADLNEPQFIAFDSYDDWLKKVETPDVFKTRRPITYKKGNLFNGFKKKAVLPFRVSGENVDIIKSVSKEIGEETLEYHQKRGENLLNETDNVKFLRGMFEEMRYIIAEKKGGE